MSSESSTWSSQSQEEKLSLSASIVYREMPYQYLRRVSQEGVPMVVSSMEGDMEETQMLEAAHQQSASHNQTVKIEENQPEGQDEAPSDAETHLFSDDERDMELTQIIDGEDELLESTPPQEESTEGEDVENVNVGPEEKDLPAVMEHSSLATTVMGESCEQTMLIKETYTATMRLENTMEFEPSGGEQEEQVQEVVFDQSVHTSVTTLCSNTQTHPAEPVIAAINTHVDVKEEEKAQDMKSESASEPSSESIPWMSTKRNADLPPLHNSSTQLSEAGYSTPSKPRIQKQSSIPEECKQECHDDDAMEDPSVDSTQSYLNRRQKCEDIGMVTPDRKAVYDFQDLSQSSVTSSATKRPIALLLNEGSQSQQETQSTPPDLGKLASTTLDAAMHVQNYVSPWSRQKRIKQLDFDKNSDFVTPPKMHQEGSPATTSATSSTRSSKRQKSEIFSPIPPRTAYTKRRVHCFNDVYFYLSGFQDTACQQLYSQIKSYGGRIEKRMEEMKKLQGRCYVIATVEASRRPKILYAMACGIPIVHPQWLSACFQARELLNYEKYWIPSGFSWVLRRSIVYIPRHQSTLFKGLRFGMVYDSTDKERKAAQQEMAHVMKFPLEHCGAISVKLDAKKKLIESGGIDVILSNELTKLCALAQDLEIPVVRLLWVNECIVQEKLVDMNDPNFAPDLYAPDGTLDSRVMEVTLTNETRQKLCVGEMVFVDLDEKPHHLLYHICQVVRLDESIDGKLSIHVQVHKRRSKVFPKSQFLVATRKVVAIDQKQIKKKACLVSQEDFSKLAYNDSSLFCLED